MIQIVPKQIDLFAQDFDEVYQSLEVEIFTQIVDTLVKNETLEQSRLRLAKDLGVLNEENVKKIAEVSKVTEESLNQKIAETFNLSIDEVNNFLKQSDIYEASNNTEQILNEFKNQAQSDLNNYVNANLVKNANILYVDILNKASAKFLTGEITHTDAIEEVLRQAIKKGLPSSFVDKGGNRWSITRYADLVVRNALKNVYNNIRMSHAGEFGIHTVVMSSLADPAPRCVHCQGKILDTRRPPRNTSGFPSLYDFGYGLPGGTLGVNCRHNIFLIDPKTDPNTMIQFETKEANERYKNSQKMNRIYRRIKQTKKEILIAEHLGTDTERLQNKLERQLKNMRVFSNETKVPIKKEKIEILSLEESLWNLQKSLQT